MTEITITLNVEQDPWLDMRRPDLVHVTTPLRIGGLPGGMSSGKASVAIAAFLPDGRPVLLEASLDHFLAAAAALKVRYAENAPRGRDA
jgi:hypothetical protein